MFIRIRVKYRAPKCYDRKAYITANLREHLGSPLPGFLVGFVLLISLVFSFLCFVFVLFCLRPVSCVPIVASFSGLSILDCPIIFSLTFIDVKVSLNQFAKNHITNMEHEEVF